MASSTFASEKMIAMRNCRLTLILAAALTAVPACDRRMDDPYLADDSPLESLSHEMIILGDKLEDPYSVENVTRALASLYPTRAGRTQVDPTDLYVRFLPADEDEYNLLTDIGLELMDHPLDYQIVKDGDYYHDPAIADDEITWQYCVVPLDFRFPVGIRHEILDRCYIAEHDPATRTGGDGIDWMAVEQEAFRLTGNGDLLLPKTRANSSPRGRITIVDEDANGGQAFGVAGVRILCNSFVKFSSAYTDRDGYYEIPKSYSSSVRYRMMFKNEKGFAIGVNLVLVPASMSALGKGSSAGIDVEITKGSDRKLFSRCVVNNAVYDYYGRCSENDLDLASPPSNLRIWLFQNLSVSSSAMLRQGVVVESSLLNKYLGFYASLIKVFLPDITLGLKGAETYADIYSTVVHEMAHASHFTRVGKDYWNKYVGYILSAFVRTGKTYGDGTGENAGYCEVGEMWGYYMQNRIYNDRYGGVMPVAGSSYWFRPQILRYLDERGMSPSDIFRALTPDVRNRNELRDRLLTLYSSTHASIITDVFNRYPAEL